MSGGLEGVIAAGNSAESHRSRARDGVGPRSCSARPRRQFRFRGSAIALLWDGFIGDGLTGVGPRPARRPDPRRSAPRAWRRSPEARRMARRRAAGRCSRACVWASPANRTPQRRLGWLGRCRYVVAALLRHSNDNAIDRTPIRPCPPLPIYGACGTASPAEPALVAALDMYFPVMAESGLDKLQLHRPHRWHPRVPR